MIVEDIDPGSYAVREVYAHYGLAMYFAQVLEHGMINTLVVSQQAQGAVVTQAELDAAWERSFDSTMGRLAAELGKTLSETSILAKLEDARVTRNRLAHRFFREHAEDFFSDQGRSEMITECEAARQLFVETDALLEPVMAAHLESLGVSRATIKDAIDQRLREARQG